MSDDDLSGLQVPISCDNVDNAVAAGRLCITAGVEGPGISGSFTLKPGGLCNLMPNLGSCKQKAAENAAKERSR